MKIKLENQVNERPTALGMPELKTNLSTGAEIGTARFRKVFEEGTSIYFINSR
jgi:hypothetical protein